MTRTRSLRIAGIVIMLASVAVVIWTIAGDEEALDLLRSVEPGAIVALMLLLVLGLPVQAYRYKLTVDEAAQVRVPAWPWFRLFIIGRFLNALLPQAGNAYRAVRLKEDYAVPVTKFLSGFVAFTWLTSILNMAAALALILLLEPGLDFGGVPAAALVSALMVVTAAVPPGLLWLLGQKRVDSGFWGWAQRRTEDMVSGAVRISRSRPAVIRFVAAGLVSLTITSAAFWLAFEALELDASVSTVVLFYALQQLATYVNITPGNLGIQELFSGGLAAQLGVGLTGGLLVASLIRLASYATLLIVGMALGGRRALAR
ncbi:MAG: flippase-like domain-containing protein, partial [bacterium]|nr:flippase-like domain-containing protein [bacterium]